MKVLSLFDGISCGMVALERAKIPVERYVAYEIDGNAIKISKKNYQQIEHCGDVTTADFSQYKGFDMVIGGSPCTFWSLARSTHAKHKREVFPEGLGWELFEHFERAIKETGAKWFLYENNSSISRPIKEAISRKLGVEGVEINSELFSAQRRKRTYWTNIPIGMLPESCDICLKDIFETDESVLDEYIVPKTPSRIRMWNDGKGRVDGAICCDNITHKLKSGTVTSKQDRNYNAGLIEYKDFCRYLTIKEQERLQTLPDDYTDGVPKSQRTKCLGNGWTVDVIAHILKGIAQKEVDENE